MSLDRRRRYKLESLDRAGIKYVDRRRWKGPAAPDDAAPRAAAEEAEAPAPPQARPAEDRLNALRLLQREVAQCTRCPNLCESRTQTVFADGSPAAELCFVGEAPGAEEDAQGVPFVGRAGQLLTRIIEACKLRREEVYICNVLKCRPPDNRNPNPVEIENCKPFLARQIELVQPKMLVALGKYAAAHLLGEKPERVPILKLRGTVHHYNGVPFMITLHPAYLLRNPEAKRDVWEDMKEVMRRLGRPVD
jgi:DNA polymerase